MAIVSICLFPCGSKHSAYSQSLDSTAVPLVLHSTRRAKPRSPFSPNIQRHDEDLSDLQRTSHGADRQRPKQSTLLFTQDDVELLRAMGLDPQVGTIEDHGKATVE
jgi:hypothetical protein